jgi:hypothetical protein
MHYELNKELRLTVTDNIVTLSTQRSFRLKEFLKTIIPQLIVFSIVFSLKGNWVLGVLIALGMTTFISLILILYRILTEQNYSEFEFNVKDNIAVRKVFRFKKKIKEIPLHWNDQQLYLRDVSRSGWKSAILTHHPDLDKPEIFSLVVIKGAEAIQLLMENVSLPYREKRNKNSFFDN